MKYAEVAVNSPIARQRSFCYSVPAHLTISVGHAVWVPFGSKVLQGVVVGISDIPSYDDTKDIIGLISSDPLISQTHVELALWLSQYYLAPLFDCIALMLPPGFERKLITYLQLSTQPVPPDQLDPEQSQVINFFKHRDKVRLEEVEKSLGKKRCSQLVRQMVKHKLLVKTEQLGELRVKPKIVPYFELKVRGDQLNGVIEQLKKKRATKLIAVIELLAECTQPMSFTEIKKRISCPGSVINVLNKRGLVSMKETKVSRNPLLQFQIIPTSPPQLTEPQETAWRTIRSGLLADDHRKHHNIFLLAGVTGSGKTEIYLKALAEIVALGKKGICLVPEIALTAQTIERFAARFLGRVAVLHSGLTLGEQFDEWHKIQNGDCDVVIGPRSALFAPQSDLGLIIIDEEHEWTYKQADKSPRYHARTTAIKLAEMVGAQVILGSATPDLESYYRSQRGDYKLVELKKRVTPRGLVPLPEVEVVDMKDELKSGNRSIFSSALSSAMSDVLQRGEQVILFLNRRGTANFVRCQVCGFVVNCRRCSVALTYHSSLGKLVCHHCNYRSPVPQKCPNCHSPQLKYFGIGTQKVEEEIRRLFPKVRMLRWDRDTTSKRGSHEAILAKFRAHDADVLIGTQMIAKGLDLPEVTLAGVISADIGLNIPDFRAAERTFQLVCQIAGRAGRGQAAGRVIVQSYCPEHYAIKAAARHDYVGFYNQEIEYRRLFGYPPFSQMALLSYTHTNYTVCRLGAEKLAQTINDEKVRTGLVPLKLIGPMPSYISRRKGHYQWQIVLAGMQLSEFLNCNIVLPQGWSVDIDPISVI